MFISVKGYILVKISGVSMHPVLQDGEKVKVVASNQYEIGDILVYGYESEGILVHRLLRIENDRYYCKGDNSFRIENITKQQVIGKIVIREDDNNNSTFINDSLKIGILYKRNFYNAETIKLHPKYKEYCHKYLKHNS